METAPRSGSPALRQGLILGIILAVVAIGFGFISPYLGLGAALNSVIVLAIYLVFGLLAGRRASTQTGKVGTGVLAGFLAGLIASVLSSILSIILVLVNIDQYRQAFQQAADQQHLHITYTNALVIQTEVLGLVFSVVLSSLIALAGGAIGGYLGKGRAPLPQQPYQESMFVPPSSSPQSPPPAPTPPEDK